MPRIIKRRILTMLIGASVFLLLGNFVLWFLHTRVINDAIGSFKKELAHHEIALSYEDIKFKNLKSWRVEGYIPNLVAEWLGTDRKVSVPKLYFKSKPFDRRLNTQLPEGIKFINGVNELSFNPQDAELSLDFEESLSNIIATLQNPEAPKLHLIDKIIYQDQGMEVIAGDELHVGRVTPMKIMATASRTRDEAVLHLQVYEARINFSPEYLQHQKVSQSDTQDFAPDFLQLELDFIYKETPSKALLNLLQKDTTGKYKKILDSFQIEFRKIAHSNTFYNFVMTGTVDRQPDKLLPDINCLVKISDYVQFAQHFKLQHEMTVNTVFGQPNRYKLSDEKFKLLLSILESMQPQDKELEIKIVSHPSYGFTIAGKPVFELATEIQGILSMERAS
jgi:hypothetical protein